MGKLEGKVAIVVGSTSGIGKTIGERFAEEGATVIITGRRDEVGKKVVDEITKAGGKADFYKLDVMDIDNCNEVIDAVIAKYGKLDILDYNAGIANVSRSAPPRLGDITEEFWDAILDTNLKSAFFMAQKALPELINTKGNIIFTASLAGTSAMTGKDGIPYGSSKAAVLHMMKMMALNVADKGVRVNAVSPGMTQTDILSTCTPEMLEQLTEVIPLKCISRPQDIANAALFLASDDASQITGQYISICGGASIG